MTGYVVLDERGLVRVAGNCRILPEGALAVVVVGRKPWVPAPGQIGLETAMSIADLACAMRAQAGGYLVARPASPVPVPVADGDSVSIPPCPAGTRIEVFDLTGREVMAVIIAEDDGKAETLTFPDPGEYEVEVQAPAPALPSSTRIMIA